MNPATHLQAEDIGADVDEVSTSCTLPRESRVEFGGAVVGDVTVTGAPGVFVSQDVRPEVPSSAFGLLQSPTWSTMSSYQLPSFSQQTTELNTPLPQFRPLSSHAAQSVSQDFISQPATQSVMMPTTVTYSNIDPSNFAPTGDLTSMVGGNVGCGVIQPNQGQAPGSLPPAAVLLGTDWKPPARPFPHEESPLTKMRKLIEACTPTSMAAGVAVSTSSLMALNKEEFGEGTVRNKGIGKTSNKHGQTVHQAHPSLTFTATPTTRDKSVG